MKSNNSNQPNNKVWNIHAVFLVIFSLGGLQIVISAQQDFFHFVFNIATVVSVFISSLGVFAYANNRPVLNQKFWCYYFYIYGVFAVFYNTHCFQIHGLPNLAESLFNSFVNVGVLGLLTLYALYRYAFIKNSF